MKRALLIILAFIAIGGAIEFFLTMKEDPQLAEQEVFVESGSESAERIPIPLSSEVP